MKKQLQTITTLVLFILVSWSIQAQTYDEGDSLALVAIRDNNFTINTELNWDDEDPANWLGVTWDESSPKRVIELNLKDDNTDSERTKSGRYNYTVARIRIAGLGLVTDLQGTVDFSSLSSLQRLDLDDNADLTGITISGLNELKFLHINHTGLLSLDASGLTSLQLIQGENCFDLVTVDISDCPNMCRLELNSRNSANSLETINMYRCPKLEKLTSKNSNLSGTLDFSGMYNMKKIELYQHATNFNPSDDELKLINFGDCVDAIFIELERNNIKSVGDTDFSSFSSLEDLYLNQTLITELTVVNDNIRTLRVNDALLSKLDVSQAPNLNNLNASNNRLKLTDVVRASLVPITRNNTDNLMTQTGYDPIVTIVGHELDYSDEALIDVNGTDETTTFALFEDGEGQVGIDNTTGLFTLPNEGSFYVTLENSGLTLTTEDITVLEGSTSILSASISETDFEIWVDQSITATLTIENTGGSSFSISDIEVPEGFTIDEITSPISLDVNESQDFTVTFSPTEIDVYGGDLIIANDATAGDNEITIAGTGLALISIIELALDESFGEVLVGKSATNTMTVENPGSTDLNITDIILPNDFSVSATTATITAGSSQNFQLTFSPDSNTDIIQEYSGTIQVVSDAGQGSEYTNVSGTGIAFSIISTTINAPFGTVSLGDSQIQTLTITNGGGVDLNVTDITVPDGFTINDTDATIDAKESADFDITFTPSEAGDFSGTISVTSNAKGGISSVSISGTAVSSALTASIAAFGEVGVGESATQELSISNTSGVDLEVSNMTVPSGFTIDTNTATISDGESETFMVTFSPTEEIAYTGDIVITSDASQSELIVTVSGTGAAILGTRDDLNQIIAMYPNPTSGGIIYVDGLTHDMSLSIYSVTGNLVKQIELSVEKNQIDVSDLLQGMYVIRSDKNEFRQSFVKN